jgi:aspartyl-tRNA synthetase
MSFIEQDDVLRMFEGMIRYIFKEVKGIDYEDEVERMSWEDAMWVYGNDKPDIRFGMKIANLKSPIKRKGAVEADGFLISMPDSRYLKMQKPYCPLP